MKEVPMKIRYNERDIEKTEKNECDEKLHVFRKTSEYFVKFNEFINEHTNALDSNIRLMSVKCVCDDTIYDYDLDEEVARFTKDENGDYDTKSDYLLLNIAGGKNGSGKWEEYFEDLSSLFLNFSKAGYRAYLINLRNDCADDVFDAVFGIK